MTRFFRVPLRRCLVAGLVFFALVLSLGHAMAGDSGSAEGGGPVGVTVTNQAPVVTQFDIRTTSNASLMGSQLDVRTTYWIWVTVYDQNNWSDIKQLDINLWYDGGSGSEKTYWQQTGVGNPWTGGSIAPGASATTGTRNVVHESNAPYKLSVYVTTTLTSPTDTIAVTNIMVTAAGDATDLITTDTAFTGLGIANRIYLLGSASTTQPFDPSVNSETTGLQFKINVPLGTPAGAYSANIVVRVEQP